MKDEISNPSPSSEKSFTLEICVDSLKSAIIAQSAGADRLELCSDLLEGGITPSYGLIKSVRSNISLDLSIMIRPRGGDFCYSDEDFLVMKEDIIMAKELAANCVVFGILTRNGYIDIDRTSQLVQLARPMQVTFHRAFDFTKDPIQALEDIIFSGADRILTSGHEPTAIKGKNLIRDLVNLSKGRISIMAGSGVNPDNKDELLNHCRVKELHLTAKSLEESKMVYRPCHMPFTSSPNPNQYLRYTTNFEIIKRMR